jgi:hypothetical protein
MDTGNSFGSSSPEIHNPNQGQAPVPGAFKGFEQLPQVQGIETPSIETNKETEQNTANREAQPLPTQSQPIIPTPQPQPTSSGPQPVTDKLPTVAGHSNRIEKTWLEKGDKIVQETKDDPYKQKIGIDNLRDEYQEARYGQGGSAAA